MDINLAPQQRVKPWQWGIIGLLSMLFCLTLMVLLPQHTTTSMTKVSKNTKVLNVVIDPSRQRLVAFSLKSLHFVGILQQGTRVWALIRAPSGTITPVQIGDYLGKRSAKVLSITAELLQVEERQASTLQAKTARIAMHLVTAKHTLEKLN